MRDRSGRLEPLHSGLACASAPAFGLALLACWEIFIIAMLLVPSGASGLGSFAEEFRIWCFGYDPATGHLQWSFVSAMLAPQLLIGACIALLWREPLRELVRKPMAAAAHLGVAAAIVAGAALGFAASAPPAANGELPFPAEALRTAYTAPALALTNQLGERVELSMFRGDVVVLTAVYASCPHTCPAILSQVKAAIAELSPAQRAELRVVAVTLDPERDSPEQLRALAGRHGIDAPIYQLVTGAPSDVEGVLDRMQIARERDAASGVISHANLFLLIDRDGRLAYRLGLGERQQRWLVSALRVLLGEQAAAG
jgi:protein SCO1/2